MRRALYAALFYAATVILTLLYIPLLALPRRWMMGAVDLWSRLAMWGLKAVGGVRIEVRGLEHLPGGGALVAAKHQSMFDILPPFAFLSDPCFVLKKELMRIPVFGWHCAKTGMIAVDREGQARALKDLVAAARDRIEAGRQVLIYPEGTRRPPGAAPDYKPGVAALYRDLGVACVPVATNTGDWLTPRGLIKRTGGVVVVQFLPAIPAGLKRGAFMQELQARIETASDALRAEFPVPS